jgi:hypothetical protein
MAHGIFRSRELKKCVLGSVPRSHFKYQKITPIDRSASIYVNRKIPTVGCRDMGENIGSSLG